MFIENCIQNDDNDAPEKNREHDCEIVVNGEIITRMIRLIDMLNR